MQTYSIKTNMGRKYQVEGESPFDAARKFIADNDLHNATLLKIKSKEDGLFARSVICDQTKIQELAVANLADRLKENINTPASLSPQEIADLLIKWVKKHVESDVSELSFQQDNPTRLAPGILSNEKSVRIVAESIGLNAKTITSAMDIVMKPKSYEKGYSKHGEDKIRMEYGLDGIKYLCKQKSYFSSEILKIAAAKKNISIKLNNDCGTPPNKVPLDFSQWCQLARQELISRGIEI